MNPLRLETPSNIFINEAISMNNTHKNFILKPTPLKNEVNIEARNRYNKTVNVTKAEFNGHMCPNGSRAFWALAKYVNSNFHYRAFTSRTSDDGSIMTERGEFELQRPKHASSFLI